MSALAFDTLAPASGQLVRLEDGSLLRARTRTPGSILQTVLVNTRRRATFSAPNSGAGTRVTPLELRIAPTVVGSTIICQWMVNGEMHNDTNFVIHRGGELMADGLNTALGNIRSSGYAAGHYDQNEDSTPANWTVIYPFQTTSLAPVTVQLAVRSSSGGNYTFALNRTINGSTGPDAYESMVSVGMAQEVAP